MLKLRFFCALCLLSTPLVTASAQDTLADIIFDYETVRAETHPSSASSSSAAPATVWPDATPAGTLRESAALRALAERLDELAVKDPSELDHTLLTHIITQRLAALRQDVARIPFTSDWGFHAEPIFWAQSTILTEPTEAEAYITRLNRLPAYIDTHIDNMRRGIRTGFTAHSDPLNAIRAQISQQIVTRPEDSVFYTPLKHLMADLQKARPTLEADALAAARRANNAYRRLLTFLQRDYTPAVRNSPSVLTLPDGEEYYLEAVRAHTTRPDLTPDAIHQLGLEEVEKLRGQMDEVLTILGFEGALADFLAFLRTHPEFYARDPEDLLEKAARITRKLDVILPLYFGKLPRLPYGVAPVPEALAPGYTTARYVPGDRAKGRAATYLVNTYRLDQRPLYELPALSAHEAVPGHHLQIALAQELEDVPAYRRDYFSTAFGEGWALYAEQIAWEAGIYETPYERFGALSYQMWRACRLVADTGLHWYGWDRQQAASCFLENTALSKLNIETEITRYIGWPGQALGYKIGALTIQNLRQEAEAALGSKFDIRAFHDKVLEAGALPLSILEDQIRRWVAEADSRAAD